MVSVWLGLCFRDKSRGGCWDASSGLSQKEPRKTTGSSRGLFRHWWFWRPKIVGRVGRATTQARGNKQLLSSKCYYSLAYIIKQWDKHALLKNKGLVKGVYTSPMGSTLHLSVRTSRRSCTHCILHWIAFPFWWGIHVLKCYATRILLFAVEYLLEEFLGQKESREESNILWSV